MTTSGEGWSGQLRALLRRLFGSGTRAPRAEPEWVLLESVHSPAMGSLHQQVLQREGIPFLVREFGGGSAILGGVPVGVSLFVPRERLADALAVLGLDPALESEDAPRE